MLPHLGEPIFDLEGAIFTCVANAIETSKASLCSRIRNGESGIWANDTTASWLGFDIIVYAKVGDGLNCVSYPALFDNAVLSDRGLYIQNLSYDFDVVSLLSEKACSCICGKVCSSWYA